MADWNTPSLTTNYTDFLNQLKDRDEDLAKMFNGTTSSNLPTGTIKWDGATHQYKEWDGSNWTALSGLVWANNKTDGQYVWVRYDSGCPLTLTRQDDSGNITEFRSGSGDGTVRAFVDVDSANSATGFYVTNYSDATQRIVLSYYGSTPRIYAYDYTSGTSLDFQIGYNASQTITIPSAVAFTSTTVTIDGNTVWHAGNDGSGSNLDADKVHGVDGSLLIPSDTSQAAGSDQITNIVSLTQAEYDALTPDASTLYVIVG